MITDLAVVTNVRAVHKEIIFSKPRTASTPLGPNIHRHVLSTDCAGSDFDARRFALKVSVLRRSAQTRVGMNSTVGSKPGSPNKRRVGTDFGPRSEFDLASSESRIERKLGWWRPSWRIERWFIRFVRSDPLPVDGSSESCACGH